MTLQAYMKRSLKSAGALKVSPTRSSATTTLAPSARQPRMAARALTGSPMSWSASNTQARSNVPTPGPVAASRTSKLTRSATPAAMAWRDASSTEVSSRSIPSRRAEGSARARAMVDQPVPQPTSRTRGSASLRSCPLTPGAAANHDPTSWMNMGRFIPAIPWRISGPKSPKATPPPLR